MDDNELTWQSFGWFAAIYTGLRSMIGMPLYLNQRSLLCHETMSHVNNADNKIWREDDEMLKYILI